MPSRLPLIMVTFSRGANDVAESLDARSEDGKGVSKAASSKPNFLFILMIWLSVSILL